MYLAWTGTGLGAFFFSNACACVKKKVWVVSDEGVCVCVCARIERERERHKACAAVRRARGFLTNNFLTKSLAPALMLGHGFLLKSGLFFNTFKKQ